LAAAPKTGKQSAKSMSKDVGADQAKKLRIVNFGLRILGAGNQNSHFPFCFLNFEIRNSKFEIASSDHLVRPVQ
jgi:hypothetical protein